MAESRWQDIYLHLKNKGIEVYSPGQHQGSCLSKYVVVKEGTSIQMQEYSSAMDIYILMCYVPFKKYSTLRPFVNYVADLMKELRPMIMPTHQRDAPYFDEQVQAHMVAIYYRNYVKN